VLEHSPDSQTAAVDWQVVWERKGHAEVHSYELEQLLQLGGYDGGAGTMPPEQYRRYAHLAATKLRLEPGDKLLDVGCGAGALLWCLRDRGFTLSGSDYAAALIEHARKAIPEATFRVAEAVDVEAGVDAIVCCSVFQYFPDLEYARRVVEGFRAATGRVLIMDIPDLETRDEAERMRAEAGSKPGEHLYYPRSFFADAEVWTNEGIGYANAPYRFHALYS
jgi:cyclopropane fatty-acyl-phospholipid synthase-like methyltransferase